MRHIVVASLLYMALVADLHQPTWAISRIHVGFLDVLLLLLLQVCTPVAAIAWGGAIGLLSDVIHQSPPGAGVVVYATLAWGVGACSAQLWAKSLFASCGISFVVLAMLTLYRSGFFWLTAKPDVVALIAGRFALTFLLATIVVSLLSSLRREPAPAW